MSSPLPDHAETVARIGELFRTHGYAGTSLSQITQATGKGKGSLYHFFPVGKQDMAEQVLAQVEGWFSANVFTVLDTAAPDDAIARMFAAVTQWYRAGRRGSLFAAFTQEAATRALFARRIEVFFRRWVVALRNMLRRAGVTGGQATYLAEDTIAAIHGALMLAQGLDTPRLFTRMMDRAQETLYNALPQ
ncbi:TetR/AcrR family transcriptional regulator [Gluconacetobacter entanii]|uniref:TetR family transcriptional regulator n=1 Tax=Gluconacetobacter entanii TaxID=108528 RepID=A0A318QB86_9PROT|nr:TetR/AcrR family transcriptional regulator [Gluconacetobacter entanii]PYD63207.1 TetR family transcriptional regulator [Gluconacetobacter entanii]